MKEGKVHLDIDNATQPRTLFKPGSWMAKIDFINHLVLFNNVLITVLSEKEGGKTSFNSLLQNNLDLQIKSISMTIKAPCDRESIINNIASQLHLNNDAQTDIASIVAQINERKAHVLLVIDDAQHLPEAFIKEAMLAIKKQDDFSFFHLCLISDYSVVATLNNLSAELFSNLIHTIELGVLSESETRTYVLQRAMNAGLINRPLSDAQFKQFYQLTKGNLAKINSNLESFIFKCSKQKNNNKSVFLKRTSLAVSAALAVGLSYVYFDSTYNKPSIDHNKIVEEVVVLSSHEEPLDSYIASWKDSSSRQLVEYALPKKQILDDSDDSSDQIINTVALVDKVVVIPTIKPREIVEEAPAPVERVALPSKLVAFVIPKHANLVKKTAIKFTASQYTIQLVASHKMSDIHRFRKNNKLTDKTRVRHFSNAKGSWYILTMGEFKNRTVAQVKVKNLPAELAKLNPWVRPTSGLSNIG